MHVDCTKRGGGAIANGPIFILQCQFVPFVGHLHVFHENILLIVSHGIKLFEVHRRNHGTKSRNQRITVIFYCVLHFDVATTLSRSLGPQKIIYIYVQRSTPLEPTKTMFPLVFTWKMQCFWAVAGPETKNINAQNVAIL